MLPKTEHTPAEYMARYAARLAGGVIVETFVTPRSPSPQYWGFQVATEDGQLHDVWVNSDPEANNCGAVNIETRELEAQQ